MSTTPTFRFERDHGRTIVTLLPELNDAAWSDIDRIGADIVQRLQEGPPPALLVDLCSLNYMGSAQVALVVRLFKTVKERKGRMVVANSDPMVQEVLTLASLDKLWTIVPNIEAGVRLLGGGHGEDDGARSVAGIWQGLLGTVCVVVSVVGLVAMLTEASWLSASTAVSVEFGAAAVAFVFGLWGVLKGSGSPRVVGTGVLVGSVALMLASVFILGSMRPGYVPTIDSVEHPAPAATAVVSLPPEPTPEVSAEATSDAASPGPVTPEPNDAPADAANPSTP